MHRCLMITNNKKVENETSEGVWEKCRHNCIVGYKRTRESDFVMDERINLFMIRKR